MKYRRISKKALIIWEAGALLAVILPILLILEIFYPRTWLWYTLLWAVGALYIAVAFVYLPFVYLSIRYAVFEKTVVCRHGVLFAKADFLYRPRISYVRIINNPLTPVLKISTLVINGAGGRIVLHMLDTAEAKRLYKELVRAEGEVG